MHVGRATRVALARLDQRTKWLAQEMGCTYQQARNYQSNEHASTRTIERLASVFGMEPLEFLKLGEE